MVNVETYLFRLLRSAVNGESFEEELAEWEWKTMFLLAQKQSLTGVIWLVLKDMALPFDVRTEIFSRPELLPYAYACRKYTDPKTVVLNEQAKKTAA